MENSTGSLPALPAEIWRMIFTKSVKHRDLIHLWTEGRHVSRLFTDKIENLFLFKHLPKTFISFGLGWYNRYSSGNDDHENQVNVSSASFGFVRLGSDRRTAIFKVDEFAETYRPGILRRMPEAIQAPFHSPKHFISFRREVNDTHLPELEFNEQTTEVSFDWRKALTQFFVEEKMYHNLLASRIFSSTSPEAQQLHQSFENMTESGRFEQMGALVEFASNQWDYSRKIARRKRISCLRQITGSTGKGIDEDEDLKSNERTALKRLEEARFSVGFADFSDEEEENEAYEAIYDSGEEDSDSDEEMDTETEHEEDDEEEEDDGEDGETKIL